MHIFTHVEERPSETLRHDVQRRRIPHAKIAGPKKCVRFLLEIKTTPDRAQERKDLEEEKYSYLEPMRAWVDKEFFNSFDEVTIICLYFLTWLVTLFTRHDFRCANLEEDLCRASVTICKFYKVLNVLFTHICTCFCIQAIISCRINPWRSSVMDYDFVCLKTFDVYVCLMMHVTLLTGAPGICVPLNPFLEIAINSKPRRKQV